MRGEHQTKARSMASLPGSSPHARGAPLNDLRDELVKRIIPACAGSTVPSLQLLRDRRDHPRMRGEHAVRTLYGTLGPGSSPHARGAR